MIPTTSLATALSAVAIATLVSVAKGADCSRDTLLSGASSYIAAQQTGKLDGLQPLFSTDVKYRQNNKDADFKTGILSKALKLDHNRTTTDTVACASYTELIATGGPYVIGTQLRYTAGKISLVDTVVATTGDWVFDAKKTLSYVATEDWGTLDESKRSTRETLKAAADSYLDMWTDGKAALDKVPWGSPCTRTEGSMHITPDCRAGAPSSPSSMRISDRRYVIDETVGSCEVLCAFGGSMPDSHEFRLVNGKLVLVHTITV